MNKILRKMGIFVISIVILALLFQLIFQAFGSWIADNPLPFLCAVFIISISGILIYVIVFKKVTKKLFLRKVFQYIGIAVVYIAILFIGIKVFLPWVTGSNRFVNQLKELSKLQIRSIILSEDEWVQEKRAECSDSVLITSLRERLSDSQSYLVFGDPESQNGYITLTFESRRPITLYWYTTNKYPEGAILELYETTKENNTIQRKHIGTAAVPALDSLIHKINDSCGLNLLHVGLTCGNVHVVVRNLVSEPP